MWLGGSRLRLKPGAPLRGVMELACEAGGLMPSMGGKEVI